MILHVGAPKCGSSALQTALSLKPDLRARDGTRYRYTSAQNLAGSWRVLTGRRIEMAARLSAYGYSSWPNLGPQQDRGAVLTAVHQTLQHGRRRGYVPILSSEGWINHHEAFAEALAGWGYPRVDVVVFLRPVIDWINAAFWQWGVWHQPTLDRWMERSNMSYSFAEDIVMWSRIPNVRLRVRGQRPEVVAKFAQIYDLPLTSDLQSNTAASAVLTGVLLRNRTFRPTGHAGAIEFIVQRWCPKIPGRRLWAVQARHVQELRPVRVAALETLKEVLEPVDLADIMSDPRWSREALYHDEILEGVTKLNPPHLFAPLYDALRTGAETAAVAAGETCPALPERPDADADIFTWDAAICPLLETLQYMDHRVRQRSVPRWQRMAVSYAERLRLRQV
jgi:hypothetical protein